MVTHGFIIAQLPPHPPTPTVPLHMLNILINAFLHIKGHFGRNFTALYCILIELNKLILPRMKKVPVLVSILSS